MNIIDYILLILLLISLVGGVRKGLISQASSLAGLLLGVWLAHTFSNKLGEWIGVEVGEIASYAILFVVGLMAAWLCSRIATWLVNGVGLGVLNRLGGGLFAVVTCSLVASLLLGFVSNLNASLNIFDQKVIEESVVAEPIEEVADFVFPYLVEAKDALMESDTFKSEGAQPQQEQTNNNNLTI